MAVNGVTERALSPPPPVVALNVGATTQGPVRIGREAEPRVEPTPAPARTETPTRVAEDKKRRIDPEKLVLRPSEVSVEDRLKLVMSLEDVQRLLLMRSPYGDLMANQAPTGSNFDSRS